MSFKLCIKDSQGISKSHDSVTVNYAIVGGNLLFSLHSKEETLVKVRSSCKIEKRKENQKRTIFLDIYTYSEGLKNVLSFIILLT